MDKGAKIRELSEMLATKTAQLAKVMRVAEAAAGDLQKYLVLTTTDKGARDVVLNVRRLHHAKCPDTGKGCDYDLGFISWIAISFGMKAGSVDLQKLKAMMQQHEALIANDGNVKTGGVMLPRDRVTLPMPWTTRPKEQGDFTKALHKPGKGEDDDRRPVQPGSPEAKGDVAPPVEGGEGRPGDAGASKGEAPAGS